MTNPLLADWTTPHGLAPFDRIYHIYSSMTMIGAELAAMEEKGSPSTAITQHLK